MVPLRQTGLGLATVMLTVILGLSSTGEGFKQELWLYTEEGNSLYFHTNVPDLAAYSGILPKITRSCVIGLWYGSSSVNYQNSHFLTHGWSPSGALVCDPVNATNLKSLRHLGANETLTDAVSLYSGPAYMSGDEIVVTSNAKTDISVPIVSLAATGTVAWMFYEGKNLDGRYVCFKSPSAGATVNHSAVPGPSVNLTTIGSIFKGCNATEIQLYRESHLM